ncbi:NifB/NifX family molybdenum-iron cluster-binding protein [Candidatus Bathyarchaeota archaeon]|nr:NifB/NifX family molybdenum-iron cluster-binding protein [Candidatus Bathyarchaeota archaeon]MBS7629520.1 NifB/NifX family molybdenum-iron cluster-binding protein [Candidatus Bathyarchaeota archaeon]
MLKIIIPIERFEGEDSLISNHFGRAPEFALVEISENHSLRNISTLKNVGEHFGGHGSAERIISDLKPDIIIAKGMGPRALQIFQSMGLSVYTGDCLKIGEAIQAYFAGRLFKLNEPCKEAKHGASQCHHP